MNPSPKRIILWGIACLAVARTTTAAEPTYFRLGSGVAKADKQPLPTQFSASNQVWKTELLPGHSTPCISGDAIYLTTYDSKTRQLATVALDRKTGKRIWKRLCPAKNIEKVHQAGSPATCTPACDGERVYSFFGSYGLLCYDLQGTLKWSKKMGPFQDEFGCASSPVLVDGKVILNQDHDIDNFLIAFDAQTGKQIWKTPRNGFTRSYSTPIVWNANGKQQLVVAGALQLTAYDPSNGKRIWWVRGLSRIVDVTPVVADGMLYIASWTPGGDQSERIAMGPFSEALKQFDKNKDGEIARGELKTGAVLARFFRIDLNQNGKLDNKEWDAHAKVFELAQNVAMAVKPGGKGDVTESHVKWTYRRGLPTVPSPLVYRGVMYMVKDGGILTALDAGNGKPLKQARLPGRGNYYASLVGGDGKLYATSERGVITIVKADKSFAILGSHDFTERIIATPVIDRGRFYVRTENALYCFSAR